MTREINGIPCSWAWDEAIARAGGQTALARAMGLSYSRVKQIQKGGTDRVKVAKKAEEVTGVPAVEILRLAPWNPDSRPAPEPGKGTRTPGEVVDFRPPPPAATPPNVVALSERAQNGVRPACVSRPASAELRRIGNLAADLGDESSRSRYESEAARAVTSPRMEGERAA